MKQQINNSNVCTPHRYQAEQICVLLEADGGSSATQETSAARHAVSKVRRLEAGNDANKSLQVSLTKTNTHERVT